MLRLIDAPADSVVTLTEARLHCRVDDGNTADDAAITRYIAAATQRLDGRDGLLGMCLRPQTWELVATRFPSGRCAIELPLPPTLEVVSVKYLDTTEAEQTVSGGDYRVILGGNEPTRIIPTLAATTWPIAAAGVPDAVRVRFTAGFQYSDSPADSPEPEVIPEPIRQAVLLLVGHWFENRADVAVGVSAAPVPQGVLDLIAPYRQFYAPETL
jgi:uncharacterized phiE125 gp8 family phage protein